MAENDTSGQGQQDTDLTSTENAQQMAQTDAQKAKATRPPNANVALAHNMPPITVDGTVEAGMATVKLPSEDQQRAGWYDENAHILIAQYPKLYKRMTPLAQTRRQGQEGDGA